MSLRIVVSIIVALICLARPHSTVVGESQNSAPAQSTESSLTVRSRTELVMIPAVVHGKSGHLTGLRKENFVLLEDGKPRDIAVFEEVRGAPETVRHAAVPEGEFTNELLGAGTPKRLTVIAVDMINTAVIDQAYVRDALMKFISQASLNGEPTALVALEPRSLRLIYDFTTEPKELAAAVTRLKPENTRRDGRSVALDNARSAATMYETGSSAESDAAPSAADAAAARQLQAWLEAKQGEEDALQFQWRMGRFSTVEALRHLTAWLAAVPGRKSLVWVTGGLPFAEAERLAAPRDALSSRSMGITRSPSLEALEQQADLWERLNAANVSVYPIDARRFVNTAFDVMSPERKYSPLYADKQIAQFQEKDRITTFEAIAQATGGKPCYNTPDLTKCFFEVSQDSSDYYQIGYYVDRSVQPGWHKLEVKCKQDGAHVRSRRGFLYKPSDEPVVRREDIALAVYSPLQISALGFRGHWTGQTPLSTGKRKIAFELRIPPESVSIDEQLKQLSLDVTAVVFDNKGKTAASVAQSISNRLRDDAIAEVHRAGIRYTNVVEVPPGDYVVRFVVRDGTTRRTGSVLAGLQVK
jgi:VWFA-related protein